MIKLMFYHCATPVGQSFSKAWDIQQCYFSLVLPSAMVGLDPWIWMIKLVFYPYVIITGQCFNKVDISQCYKRFLFSTFYLLALPSAMVGLEPWIWMIKLVFYPYVIITGQCFKKLGISQCYKNFLCSTFYLLALPSAMVGLDSWMGMTKLVFYPYPLLGNVLRSLAFHNVIKTFCSVFSICWRYHQHWLDLNPGWVW